MERLTNEVRKLQRECGALDEKLKKANPSDDKLTIYKTQASAVSKKKEQKLEQQKTLETEKIALEKLMNDKEQVYAQTKGATYMKRDDFKQYAASLRGKSQQFKKMKKILDEIRSELNVLLRTEGILKGRAGDVQEVLAQLEESKGVGGYSKMQDQFEDVSKNKQNIDKKKDQTLQEISKIVSDIESQLKEKKAKLAPQIKQLRAYRQKYNEMEVIYGEKKRAYDNTVMNLEQEKNKLEAEANKLWEDYKSEETKYH